MTAATLSQRRIPGSVTLEAVARNAFEAGFTAVEYDLLRRTTKSVGVPDHLVVSRDERPQYRDRFYEIDARVWRSWLNLVRAGHTPERALELFLADEAEASTSVSPAADQSPTESAPTAGTPAIFAEDEFGHVAPRPQGVDQWGDLEPMLSGGVPVAADASPEEFARVWSSFLATHPAIPHGEVVWAYSVQPPGEVGAPTADPVSLTEAFELLRTVPGSRLFRRAQSRWEIAPTPFPRVRRPGWGPIDGELRSAWYRAISKRPPSGMGMIARIGGTEYTPDDWRILARRAHDLGFTPRLYKQLALGVRVVSEDSGERVPEPYDIEFWAAFPSIAPTADTPVDAVSTVLHARRAEGV
jgi:hypothetical protein